MASFDLSLVVTGVDTDVEGFEDRFCGVDCHQPTVCVQAGQVILDFTMEADSPEEAVAKATRAAEKAGATVHSVVHEEGHAPAP